MENLGNAINSLNEVSEEVSEEVNETKPIEQPINDSGPRPDGTVNNETKPTIPGRPPYT